MIEVLDLMKRISMDMGLLGAQYIQIALVAALVENHLYMTHECLESNKYQ